VTLPPPVPAVDVDALRVPARDDAATVRTILAVTCEGSRVASVAAELARAHNARLRLVEAWSEGPFVRWIWAGWFVPPVTPQEILAVEELAADERARRAYWMCNCSDVVFSCRRGGAAVVAAREALRGRYELVVVDSRCRGRRLLAAVLRRLGAELVVVGR
jgi:hypothetical protein